MQRAKAQSFWALERKRKYWGGFNWFLCVEYLDRVW